MNIARRGFLGLLGAAAVATAAPITFGQSAQAETKSKRPATLETVYVMDPRADPDSSLGLGGGVPKGTDLFARHVRIDITPLRRGRVTKKVTVTIGPRTEHSYKDDFVAVAGEDLYACLNGVTVTESRVAYEKGSI